MAFPYKKSTSSCPRTKNPTARDCTVGISHFARSTEWRYACVLLDAMPRMNVKRKLLGEWCELSFCHMSNGQYWVLVTINRGWSSNG